MNIAFSIDERLGQVNPYNVGLIFALLAALSSSSKAIFVKLIYDEVAITPIELLLMRLLVALPVFVVLACWCADNNKAKLTPSSKEFDLKLGLLVLWLGFTGYYFASLTDFIGLQYISAGLERLVLFTYPTIVIAIDSLIRRRFPTKQTLLGVALCYLGLVAAFGHDLSQTENSAAVWKGVGWVFVSGIAFALYYLGTGKAVKRLGAKRLTGYAGIAATAFTMLHFSLVGSWSFIDKFNLEIWIYILLISVLCTILPSIFLAAAVQRLGASDAASVGAIGPVLTIMLAWIVLGERISLFQFLGMSLVVYGVFWINRARRGAE